MASDYSDLGNWQVVKSVRNPWGEVPLTAGGRSLPGRAREYMDRLLGQQRQVIPSAVGIITCRSPTYGNGHLTARECGLLTLLPER
jgi:hypothetical protein